MADEQERIKVVLELSYPQAVTLTGLLGNALCHFKRMLIPMMSTCESACEAQEELAQIGSATERCGVIARLLPNTPAWYFYEQEERELLERIAELATLLEHTHPQEVEDRTKVQ
jgi:hypothetical protein